VGGGVLTAHVPEEGPRELRTLARTFNRMIWALAANLAAQRDFVANASHQLRTPLTGLRLRLEAIRGEGGYAANEAAKAEAELDRLSELVDDLLALERASSGDSRAQPVDLSVIAREAVERWEGAVAAEDQRLELEAGAPAPTLADPTDLTHVADNLIENALRYCPPGTSIKVSTAARDGEVALLVADTGPGIPPADRERIFERFYRGANGALHMPAPGSASRSGGDRQSHSGSDDSGSSSGNGRGRLGGDD
jgi:signal transduction histidine kinase